MVEKFFIAENEPFPNSYLPVLYYPEAVRDMLEKADPFHEVLDFFIKNGYSNGWKGGIFTYHHFHSNTHEVLACISGEATVQLGGPGAEMYTFKKGDVVLLPAGVSHKLIEATEDFQIVGAYPDGTEPDMQKGQPDNNYTTIKARARTVPVPATDPVGGKDGAVLTEW